MSSLPLGEQDPEEVAWMLGLIGGRARRILEIGSRRGNTLRMMAEATGYRAVRAIDIADGGVVQNCATMRDLGVDAECLIADSRSPEAIKWATEHGPYDFIFIDGDHDYEAVKADWNNYRALARDMVGFHDIARDIHGVKQFWAEIRGWPMPTSEFTVPGGFKGIGIVHLACRA